MQDKSEKLAKNTIIILISKFCTQFLSFFILPILTKVLTKDEYGAFDLITTYAWLIVPFMSIQLENGIFRYLIDVRNKYKDEKIIISNGFLAIILNMIIFSMVYIILKILFKFDYALSIYLYAISTLFLNIPLQISRGLGDNINYAKASIITGISNVLLCIILIGFYRLGLPGMIIAGIASNILGGIYLFIKKKILQYLSIKNINKNKAKELIKYSIPLVPNSISSWLINISDKLMIFYFLGASANGIYSISTKFSILLSHFYSVFNLSWTESASVNVKDKEKEKFFSSAIDNIYLICACICLLVISAMPIVFRVMIDSNFSEAYKYIPLLIIGSMFEIFSGLIGSLYISLKLSKNIALSTFIAGLINILINIVFIQKYGIYVACISTICAYMFLSFYRIIDIRKYLKLSLDIKKYLYTMFFMIILIILYQKNSIVISIVSTILTIGYTLIINKNLINNILEKIKKSFQ